MNEQENWGLPRNEIRDVSIAWMWSLSTRILTARTFTPERSNDNEKALVKRWLTRCGQGHGKKHRLGVPLGISNRVKS